MAPIADILLLAVEVTRTSTTEIGRLSFRHIQ